MMHSVTDGQVVTAVLLVDTKYSMQTVTALLLVRLMMPCSLLTKTTLTELNMV